MKSKYLVLLSGVFGLYLLLPIQPVHAGGSLSVSPKSANQPVTIRATLTGGSECFWTDKPAQIKLVGIVAENETGAQTTEYTKGSYSLSKNGQALSGSTGQYGFWYPQPPFNLTSNDTVVVTLAGVRFNSPGRYYIQARLQQDNGNQCPSVDEYVAIGQASPESVSQNPTHSHTLAITPTSAETIPAQRPPIVTLTPSAASSPTPIKTNVWTALTSFLNQLFSFFRKK